MPALHATCFFSDCRTTSMRFRFFGLCSDTISGVYRQQLYLIPSRSKLNVNDTGTLFFRKMLCV